MNELLNKKIEAIFIDGSLQEYLQFKTNSGDVIYCGCGDCCSETYFSDLLRVKNLIGHRVLKVEEVKLMEGEAPKHKSRREEDTIYGVKLTTDIGTTMIIYRNSSNGYYGGSAELVNNIPEKKKNKMLEITEDYSTND